LATELAYGVARRALTLDAAIAAHSKRSLKKLETAVHVALRLGAYRLLFLDRVPEHAAVDETVELVKQQGLARAASFVNAVLRKIAADKTIPLPDEPLERLSVAESHPAWLVRRWAARFGPDETTALCRADNEAAPVCVRVNTTRATREEAAAALAACGVASRPTALSPIGLLLEEPGPLFNLEPFKKGLFQVQDEAAQLVSMLAVIEPGMRVLDACAAPGGKTCHLAERLQGKGEVYAVDIHERKLQRLETEARRLGIEGLVRPRAADASRPLPFAKGSFDVILLDAPCTGLGTLRRHPEIRYRRVEGDIARMAGIQATLANNLLRYLKPGGSFVYSVCSMEPEEGEQRAESLVDQGLSLAPPQTPGVPWSEVTTPSGTVATF
ncbi:MAG TPA: 16S rRNA (cytosine(967)-C(5))-methyltransferase RsmB, partial [Myxococcales bacterium]|nr:16S rRNA (cytosine(967)-C(5))-methyltransferase RsmB [Myxococcales bacterium]